MNVAKAARFAAEAHASPACKQKFRKYSGDPYIIHPLRVAESVARVGMQPYVIAAAMLHDVVEDCGVTLEEIRKNFGPMVESLVEQVTDVSKPEDGNRAARKSIARDHLAQCDHEAATIKLADIIDNTNDIASHDMGFLKVYIQEIEKNLDVLGHGDKTLFREACESVRRARQKIAEHDDAKAKAGRAA
jgi:(p)ppGpp synthase/HD superfamily hydrolase